MLSSLLRIHLPTRLEIVQFIFYETPILLSAQVRSFQFQVQKVQQAVPKQPLYTIVPVFHILNLLYLYRFDQGGQVFSSTGQLRKRNSISSPLI